MCKYCDTPEYVGELFPFRKNIDGSKQSFEVYIFNSPEDECHVLEINGSSTVLRIEIKFCPICGKKL